GSRRVTFFLIASRRPGKAGCFGIGGAPCRDVPAYQLRLKSAGFSDLPKLNHGEGACLENWTFWLRQPKNTFFQKLTLPSPHPRV
ncbi:hypothetical protein, partial [Rhodovulum sp.]|uniref:hypothetical protein n=1 Tax=Rhodovulum sp. TaxID=34009 RepID=UPI00257DE536